MTMVLPHGLMYIKIVVIWQWRIQVANYTDSADARN